MLNYLEGIATASDQGFYNEAIVRDHLEFIIKFHADEFLGSDMMKRMELDPYCYDKLKKLVTKWDDQQSRFKL